MQQTLGKFDQKASQIILFSRFFVCKEIVNMLNWNKVLVEGGNHNLKCTPVEKGESYYVKKAIAKIRKQFIYLHLLKSW
jgi:hypothetical protein